MMCHGGSDDYGSGCSDSVVRGSGDAVPVVLRADAAPTRRGVRPAQLKSIFERPPSAAAAGEENQDPQGGVGLHDAACEGGKGLGLTVDDIGVQGEQQAPARQIVSSGMICQVTRNSECSSSCLAIVLVELTIPRVGS